eukprot:662271-Pyramimonas_sp.AAC.1
MAGSSTGMPGKTGPSNLTSRLVRLALTASRHFFCFPTRTRSRGRNEAQWGAHRNFQKLQLDQK